MADVDEASLVAAQSYGSSILSDEEWHELRKIQNYDERETEILARSKLKSNGKTKSISDIGNPIAVTWCLTVTELVPYFPPRLVEGSKGNLAIGIFLASTQKLIGVANAAILEKHVLLNQETPTSPFQSLDQETFSSMYRSLHKNNAYSSYFTDDKLDSTVLHEGPSAVLSEYRGSKLLDLARFYLWQNAQRQGYGVIFGLSTHPATHSSLARLGFTGLPECSFPYQDFKWEGKKPFEGIKFQACIEGANSMPLGYYGIIKELVDKFQVPSSVVIEKEK